MEHSDSFKIIGLKVDGIRKLSAIEMKFNDNGLIPIVGKNKQGKTTVLDSLEILLRGGKAIPKDIIQHGKDRAEIIGQVGEYEIKRVITIKSNRLEIKNKDGLEMTKKPQAFLDTLINELTFDPRPFLNKTPAEKLKFMMILLKLDFTKQDAKIGEFEQERLLVGREVANMGEIEAVEQTENVDIEKLFEEKKAIESLNERIRGLYEKEKEDGLKEIVLFNDEQKERKTKIENSKYDIGQARCQKTNIQKQIEELNNHITRLDNSIKASYEFIAKIETPEELKPLEVNIDPPKYGSTDLVENRIKGASETNHKADLYGDYLKKIDCKEDKEKDYKTLSGKINTIRDEKKKILSEVDIPVSGLEIREDGIYHNGIYSENWSESEGLRISSELCVAMNPKLRAIFIDKGESYDSDSLKELEQWALKNNFPVFITIVNDIPDEMEAGTFYIEEGRIITHDR